MTAPRGLGPTHGAQWRDRAMARAYVHRPPYPPETFDVLRSLCAGAPPHRVLDVGAGTGDLARGLASASVHVDALEPSDAMRAIGSELPGGDAVRWIAGTAESGRLDGPYDLITAAESIHWLDWDTAFPRLASAMAANALLTIVGRQEAPLAWGDELRSLIADHSTNREFEPYDAFAMLAASPWFEPVSSHMTEPVEIERSIDEYIESIHSRNGFSRDRMSRESAARFDAAYRDLLRAHQVGELLTSRVRARLLWGRLRPPPE